MIEIERAKPSMPRVAWLERDRVAPASPAPTIPLPPPPPARFKPKSPIRERLFPSAQPIASAIRRVSTSEGTRLVHVFARPPVVTPDLLLVSHIISVVAEFYGVAPASILNRARSPLLVLPRQVAMYLSRALTTCSTTELGRQFGNKDHATIMHGARRIAERIVRDQYLAEDVADIRNILTQTEGKDA